MVPARARTELERLSIDATAIFTSVFIGRSMCIAVSFAKVSVARASVVGLCAICFLSLGARNRRPWSVSATPGRDLRTLAAATVGSSLLVSAVHEVTGGRPSSVLGATLLVLPALVITPAVRAAGAVLAPRLHRSGARVIVVGTGRVADRLAGRLNRRRGVTVVGHVDDQVPRSPCVIGALADLPRLCAERDVDGVLVAFSAARSPDTLALLRAVSGQVSVSIVPRFFELLTCGATVDDFFGIPVMHVMRPRHGPKAITAKRALDIMGGLALALLLSPVLAVAALAIKLTSPGPVMFRQTRTGLHGRPFLIFKFRTMTTDAERQRADLLHRNEADGPVFKMRQDPRTTRVGGLLRRTSVDELPQLLNVVRGDMSLVGPRPLPVTEAALVAPSGGVSRTAVRPGMTGLWQVSGRSALTYDDLAQLDAAYAASWSLAWDLRILLRTPACVLRRDGAY
jgi:exopolysaccharide biosynthesis polyprenyl glycosylphosphotransferase